MPTLPAFWKGSIYKTPKFGLKVFSLLYIVHTEISSRQYQYLIS